MSRPKHDTHSQIQTFPLAHPPPKPHSRLRLTPRRLLQIQHLTNTTTTTATNTSSFASPRAIPILEVYQPSCLGRTITPGESGGREREGGRKLHSRDLYIARSEDYAHLRMRTRARTGTGTLTLSRRGEGERTAVDGDGNGNGLGVHGHSGRDRSRSRARAGTAPEEHTSPRKAKEAQEVDGDVEGNGGDGDRGSPVVAVIYTSSRRQSKSKARSKSAGGSAEGGDETDGGVVGAELYFPFSRATWSASVSSRGRYRFCLGHGQGQDDGQGEALVLEWERRPPSRSSERKDGREDGDRLVLGIAEPAGLRRPWLAQLTRKGVQVGGWDRWQGEKLLTAHGGEEELYTWILTMAVWIARQEGWLNN